jgi:hypothetical protein
VQSAFAIKGLVVVYRHFLYLFKKAQKNPGQFYPCKEPNSNRASAMFVILCFCCQIMKKTYFSSKSLEVTPNEHNSSGTESAITN